MAAANQHSRRPLATAAAAIVATILLTSLALLALGRMTDEDPDSAAPSGAELATIPRPDGGGLAARLWTRHSDRIALLLHGFAGDQHDWDETIEPLQSALQEPISVLSFDFRGHGDSAGENRDLLGVAADVRAAIAYARSRGFSEIVLIGASMGGAAAIIAASEDPSIAGVIALSAPAELGDLDAVAAMRTTSTSVGLIAAIDDASAAESLERLRDEAGRPTSLAIIYPGRAHGIELARGAEVRERMARAIDDLWGARPAD